MEEANALFPLPFGLSPSVHQKRCLGRAGEQEAQGWAFTYDLLDVDRLVQHNRRASPRRAHCSHTQEELVP